MKKILSIIIAIAMCATMTMTLISCQDKERFTIALITDGSGIDDKSYNEVVHTAIEDFIKDTDYTYLAYKVEEDTTKGREDMIVQAIDFGAEIVILTGYVYEEPVYNLQTEHPDVKFVILDGTPNSGEDSVVADNTTSIMFKEEQAGYLAGYSAVADGHTNLGFMGGVELPSVQRFGLGFVQGVYDCAKALDIEVNLWYAYAGTFTPCDEVTTKASQWIDEGCTTIFSCGAQIYESVCDAIIEQDNTTTLIGVDTDLCEVVSANEKYKDVTVTTSAMKSLADATQTVLENWATDKWDTIGGKVTTLGISSNDNKNYVGLPTKDSSWNFESFTLEEYNEIVGNIRKGEINVSSDISVDVQEDMGTKYPSVVLKEYVELLVE